MFPTDLALDAGVELRHLQYFAALAEERHFGRAAERVFIAQSPFSRQIRQLESALGCRLVDRSSHVTGLTPAGEVVAERAVDVLAQVDDLIQAARRASAGQVAALRIGFVNEVTADLLPRSLKRQRDEHPDVHIDLQEARNDTLLHGLRQQQLDVAFVRSPGPVEDVTFEVLAVEDLVLAASGSAEESSAGRSLADYANHSFVVPEQGAADGLRRDVLDWCHRCGFEPSVAREANPLTAMLLHVAAGEGIALVPASIAHQYPVPGVRYVSLVGPTPTSEVGLAWCPEGLSVVVEDFLALTRDLARAADGEPDVWPERHLVDPARRTGESEASAG